MSADEKRNRKNEMARIRRANSKSLVVEIEEAEPTPEPPPEPTPEPEPSPEEIAQQRKEAIAEKRRQSLIIARSKITPKNVIRKDAIDKVNKKDIELNDAKREAEAIKKKAYEEAEATKKKAAEDVEVMKSLVKTKIISDADANTHKRSKSVAPKQRVLNRSQSYTLEPPPQPQQAPQQQPPPQQPQARPDLIQMSYTEQLRQKLRQEQFQRLMSDTFG